MNRSILRWFLPLVFLAALASTVLACSTSAQALAAARSTPVSRATPVAPPPAGSGTVRPGYDITNTLSDGAQRNTIAFDGLAFLTGNLGADSFFPPGKVADFWGFQYLRDNDSTEMGHNTDFLTSAAFNLLHVLTAEQRAQLVTLAQSQVASINQYGMDRFPLMDAFRRLLEGDLPKGTSALDLDAVQDYSAQLYRLDGQISYERAAVMGSQISQFTAEQRAYLDALVGKGMANWPRVDEPEDLRGLDRDVKVAVMTYAGDMLSWYLGSVAADVYFCPERQGTYFGSFYMKDAPAVGNPGYSIPVTMTGEMGDTFLTLLTPAQAAQITGLVEAQRPALEAIVARREEVSRLLRTFMSGQTPDSDQVLALMEEYGRLDGEIIYRYATAFAAVGQSLSAAQKTQLVALRNSILGSLSLPEGAFLYAQPIPVPDISSTDFLFGVSTQEPTPTATLGPTPAATPTRPQLPTATPTVSVTNAIVSVSPAFADQGQRHVVVTLTLSSLAGLPANVAPTSVRIGALEGKALWHNGLSVRATFEIPPDELIGRKDVIVTFAGTSGPVTFTSTGGFEVRRRPPPPPRVSLPLLMRGG